jgi:arabinan endo-1,5-alpha-L-arabinosidase
MNMKKPFLVLLVVLCAAFNIALPVTADDPETYTNPVLDADYPDPDVIQVGDTYYMYATNGERQNVRAARSTNLVEWEPIGDVLPRRPQWAVAQFGYIWAPEVTTYDNGETFVMYFVARYAIDLGGTQCIGVATAEEPEGDFIPVGDEPLVCQVSEGGSIDMSAFEDEDGSRYVLWKNDGNAIGGATWLYIQRVSEDGLTLEGEPVQLIRNDLSWEGINIEAPTMWKHEGKYYLFYSGNMYNTQNYAVSYAVADNIFGPYEKAPRPILRTSVLGGIVGPGGQDIVTDDEGDTWMLFHGWRPAGYRAMNLVALNWEDGVPVTGTLTREEQPAP